MSAYDEVPETIVVEFTLEQFETLGSTSPEVQAWLQYTLAVARKVSAERAYDRMISDVQALPETQEHYYIHTDDEGNVQ